MLDDDVTIGVSLTGAMTPAGLGIAVIIPLIEQASSMDVTPAPTSTTTRISASGSTCIVGTPLRE